MEVLVQGNSNVKHYRQVCIGCKCQFKFSDSEIHRTVSGPIASCSVNCPGMNCGRRVQWSEAQTQPVALPADETPLPVITA